MPEVIIYTKDYCHYCTKAKNLLRSKDIKFIEIDVTNDEAKQKEMIKRSGGTAVPEIFINGRHIGGCYDLYELETRGELDGLLKL